MPGVPLAQLLDGLLGVLIDARLPAGGGPEVTGVAILDVRDVAEASRDHHGELMLVIGARGREAWPMVHAAARGGAVAVAVKADPIVADHGAADLWTPDHGAADHGARDHGVPDHGAADHGAGVPWAADPGVPVLLVRPAARWDQLVMALRERLDAAELGHRPGGPGPAGNDLFALAEDTAVATGGIVSIEDAGNRVLAYSRAGDEVDELRRLSILGWRGPEPYMRMLREWGVLDRLRADERVVHVEEHPELGIRPRLAVGVRAGSRYLGTIWVQRRAGGFAERAEEVLVGAARLAAAEILRRRTGSELGRDSRQRLLADLLTGRGSTDLVAGRLGLDPAVPAVVVGFAGPAEPDAPADALRREQALGLVSVYATAHHRHALVGLVEGRVYAVLPAAGVSPALLSWVRHAVRVLRTTTGARVCAGVGHPASELSALVGARSEADRALDALLRREVVLAGAGAAGTAGPGVATIDELWAEVLLDEALGALAARPELGHPGIVSLAAHDARRGGDLVESVLAYLQALGDVRAASATLTVHPNTLRHRLRRARELSGIDLDDPTERLACHLQLLLVSRGGGVAPPRR
ncbi:MAG: PucR family transcriptional regulator [Pseudonocardia sp.]